MAQLNTSIIPGLVVGSIEDSLEKAIDLRALIGGAVGEVIAANGAFSAGDGAGGLFRWALDGAGSDFTNTVIPLDYRGLGRWKRVNGPIYDIRAYGADSTAADNTQAIGSAFDAAIAANGTVLIPDKTYNYSGNLDKTGSCNIVGDGPYSILNHTALTGTGLVLRNATGVMWSDFKLKGNAVTRSLGFGLQTLTCSQVLMERVLVDGFGASGMWHQTLTQSIIAYPDVRNTFADGIDITTRSKDVTVIGGQTFNTGDDAYAALSFLTDGSRCERIRFIGCGGEGSAARGFSNIGSRHVLFLGGQFSGTSSSGIIVAEDVPNGSFAPDNTIIIGVALLNSGTYGTPTGNKRGVEIGTTATNNKLIGGSTINGATRGVDSNAVDISVIGWTANGNATLGYSIAGAVGAQVIANSAALNGQIGVFCQNLSESVIHLNTAYNNNVAGPSGANSNIQITGCTNSSVKNNPAIDDRGGGVLVHRGIDFNTCSNISFDGEELLSGSTATILGIDTTNSRFRRPVFTTTTVAAFSTYAQGQVILMAATSGVNSLFVNIADGNNWKSVALT